jgi:hypothetical protein
MTMPDRSWFDGGKFLAATDDEIAAMTPDEQLLYEGAHHAWDECLMIEKRVEEATKDLHSTTAEIRELESKAARRRMTNVQLQKIEIARARERLGR